MSFSTDWLDLREPSDLAARDAGLLAEARLYLGRLEDPCVVDLGCGTGATARAFADKRLRWRLVDHDPTLLALAASRIGLTAETYDLDLAAIDRLPLDGAHMVTASALLDLMPRVWIETLADRLATAGIAAYAALSYDGFMSWDPPDPRDATVRAAFNQHQRGDKGLGPAAGPQAAAVFATAMERRGYIVRVAASPWRLGAEHAVLREQLISGIAKAAAETGHPGTELWVQARRELAASGNMVVGHVDVLALPPGFSTQSKITSVSKA